MESKPEVALDGIDHHILMLLQEDGKMNNKEIASRVGLSVTPTFERIKRMERQGVIQGYTAKVNLNAIGKGLQVFCQVSLQNHQVETVNEFEAAVIELKEITSAFHVAGTIDYLLLIRVKDMDAYQQFLKNKITRIPHIRQVNSNFVMTVVK
jgi:DNA-binding Lrp family transcriptional regulator